MTRYWLESDDISGKWVRWGWYATLEEAEASLASHKERHTEFVFRITKESDVYKVYDVTDDGRVLLGAFATYEAALRCFNDHCAGGMLCELIDTRTGRTPPQLVAQLKQPLSERSELLKGYSHK